MPAAALTYAALTLAVAALGAGPKPGVVPSPRPEPPVTEIHQVLYAIQGDQLNADFPFPISSESEGRNLDVVVAVAPIHGQFFEGVWPRFAYLPDEGYFGRDRLTVEVYGSSLLARLDVEIDVLPRRIPVAGRWTPGSQIGAGLYHPLKGFFQLCSPDPGSPETGGQEAYLPLICTWSRVLGAPAAAVPLVLPGVAGAADQLALFAQSSGTLYFLRAAGSDLGVERIQIQPGAVDHFPVAGSFDGGPQATIAFVGRGGQVAVLGKGGELTSWRSRLELLPGDDLPWPVQYPRSGGDALALLERPSVLGPARLSVWTAGGFDGFSKDSSVLLPLPEDLRRPIWVRNYGGGLNSLSTLVELPDEGETGYGLYLKPIHFGHGGTVLDPQTLPLKFPNDPPGP